MKNQDESAIKSLKLGQLCTILGIGRVLSLDFKSRGGIENQLPASSSLLLFVFQKLARRVGPGGETNEARTLSNSLKALIETRHFREALRKNKYLKNISCEGFLALSQSKSLVFLSSARGFSSYKITRYKTSLMNS
jgi:hypothetical protein